jgi:hypothetical protein
MNHTALGWWAQSAQCATALRTPGTSHAGMRDNAELSHSVVAFVRDHVETLEQLEVLTLLIRSPERWWDAAAVAEGLGINATITRDALERLASRNLLAISITTDVRYQLQPGTATLRDASEEFAEACRINRVAVLRLVTDTQRRVMRDFAEAFRLRRHDDR